MANKVTLLVLASSAATLSAILGIIADFLCDLTIDSSTVRLEAQIHSSCCSAGVNDQAYVLLNKCWISSIKSRVVSEPIRYEHH